MACSLDVNALRLAKLPFLGFLGSFDSTAAIAPVTISATKIAFHTLNFISTPFLSVHSRSWMVSHFEVAGLFPLCRYHLRNGEVRNLPTNGR